FRALLFAGQTVCFAHVFWAYGYSIGWGQGASMVPTFHVANETLLISKRHRRGRGVRVGDCVCYDIPVEPGAEGLKRVIGMPGDYVLLNSPGAKNDHMLQVPKGHCYIIGDNLPWSRDSRDFGPLPLALIKGKVIAK
ncbi:peptidase S24/S26A/S26B/S26C, partial [Xylariales sp. AK1849]